MKSQNNQHQPAASFIQNGNAYPAQENNLRALLGGKAHSALPGRRHPKTETPVFKLFPIHETYSSAPDFLLPNTTSMSENKPDTKYSIATGVLQKAFFNQTTSMTWFVDEDDCLIYANPALLSFLNIDAKDLNKKVSEIIPEFILEKFLKAHVQVRTSGVPNKKIMMQPMADGSNRYFLINIYPFTNRFNKNLLAGEAFDITHSFRVQEEMARTNERLIYMSKVTTEAIWEWDIESGYVFRNDRLINLIGANENQTFDSEWWYNLIHPEDREKVKSRLQYALKEKQSSWEHEFRIKTINEDYITLHEQGFIIYKNGRAVKMIGSLRDITELKILESKLVQEKVEQQKKLTETMIMAQEQERTRLGQELHDNVNQLLATSKLFLSMLKTNDEKSDEMKNMVSEYIQTACNEIRNLSHGLVVANFDQNGLIGSFKKTLNDIARSNTFEVEFQYEDNVESLNNSRKITLVRILQEQIKNVINYSKATKVEVSLRVINNKVQLHVKDNGVGFDASASRRGIGLTNIYERTKLYNGDVELNSSPGNGCELKVLIPLKDK